MTILYNRKEDKAKRQRLRNNATIAEKILWENIRKRQIEGCKFRRQYGIGSFVIDFYCTEIKLAIEVDGGIHLQNDVKLYDKERERIISSLGVEFLRFTNDQVINNLNKTINTIKRKTKSLKAAKDANA